MHCSTALSIFLLATTAIATPIAYNTGNEQDIAVRDTFSEAPSYIISRDASILNQRALSSWKKKIGASPTFTGAEALAASILKAKGTISFFNSASYDYIGQTGTWTASQSIPETVQSLATSDAAAEALIKSGDPLVAKVVNKYNEIVKENDGSSGQGTLLGNHEHSLIS